MQKKQQTEIKEKNAEKIPCSTSTHKNENCCFMQ